MNVMNDELKPIFVSMFALATPDVVSIFQTFGPVLDGLLRVGQLGVAVVTVIYFVKKIRRKTHEVED